MTYTEYLTRIKDAMEFRSSEELLANIGFGDNIPYTSENWQKICDIIFAAAHGDIAALSANMAARAFAVKYGLPERTVQHWISGARTAPDYVINFVGYAMIGDIPQDSNE